MSKVTETVTELTKEVIEKEGFELFDLEFVKEGKNWFLRFYLDKPGGIDLDDCAFMSEKFSEILDAQDPDPIPQAYFLEVSSPGVEKPLKTFEQVKASVGKYVYAKFINPTAGMDEVEGFIKTIEDETIEFEYLVKNIKKRIKIDYSNIKFIRLAVKF